MVRKKIDNRIRVLIENGVKLGHRTFFVIVGDKGRDQVSVFINFTGIFLSHLYFIGGYLAPHALKSRSKSTTVCVMVLQKGIRFQQPQEKENEAFTTQVTSRQT